MSVTVSRNGAAALAARNCVTVGGKPGCVNIEMTAGDDFLLRMIVTDKFRNPIDMEGATVRGHIREFIDDDPELGEFVFCGIQGNNIFIRIDASLSETLPPKSVFDIEVARDYDLFNCPGPFVLTWISGTITINPEVTR